MNIYKVLIGGRDCLSDKNGRYLRRGDFIHGGTGLFMLKIATKNKSYCTTSMFVDEVNWERQKDRYRLATKEEIIKIIPHLSTGKRFDTPNYKKHFSNLIKI